MSTRNKTMCYVQKAVRQSTRRTQAYELLDRPKLDKLYEEVLKNL